MSTPTLALTLPSPKTGFHSSAISLANSASNELHIVDQAGGLTPAFSAADSPSTNKLHADGVFLSRSLIEFVFNAYDAKLLKSSPEVRRAVRKEQKANRYRKKDSVSYAREDDGTGKDGLSSIAGLPSVASHSHLLSGSSLPLASGFKTGLASGLTGTLASTLTGGSMNSGAASVLMPMSDLEEFIEVILGEISYRRNREEKREKRERKERIKIRIKEEKEEQKERERERERDKKGADNLSSSSSSDGLVDFSRAAKKVKAKVKGRSVDKGDERDSEEAKDVVKEHKRRKDKDNVGGVGGLVLGLWTGRVNLVIKLREKTEERERERERSIQFSDARQVAERDGVLSDGVTSWQSNPKNTSKDFHNRPSLWSDGDADTHAYSYDDRKRISLPARDGTSPTFARRSSVSGTGSRGRYGSVQNVLTPEKSDGRSTEEEGPGLLGSETLGALWAKSGSKVKDKLESWAG
ncbi:uncharacterized protein C8R40DRAFT_447781 [Lentinula edodes]|uniref:uncharacterized protein n=1 Tax=Lentinula edodes TaxID=5353 RepID=UPI001E8E1FA9|nr:uncharacterized protein C8R40DRAFT_447781 [Lentinula edodes]KAH7879834.1 hypothetical protein C8R40DRAFT_447781 [Lentinula edodes]